MQSRSASDIVRWTAIFCLGLSAIAYPLKAAEVVVPHGETALPPVNHSLPIFDVPRLDSIAIDGKPDDWADRGFRIDVMASTAPRVQSRVDLDGTFRLGWDNRGLLVLLNVKDDVPAESPNRINDGDSIEMYLSPRVGSHDVVQVLIAPGMDPASPKVRTVVRGPTLDPAKKIKPTVTVARTAVDGGYQMEVLIPWENLRERPEPGSEIGFQVIINDRDGDAPGGQLLWYPSAGTLKDRTKMYRLRLAEKAGPPVRAAAFGDYVRFHKTRINVMADLELAGKTVEVREGGRTLMRHPLAQDFVQPDRASATLNLPMPARDKPYGTLDVLIDGQPIAALNLPAPIDAARWLLPYQDFVFKPCVFSGRGFPEGDFEDPSYVEDMIGPYEVRTTYYDTDYNPVTKADKPGRYGAVVEIHTDDGKVFKRYRTLFREPKDISWRNAEMPFTVKLPKEFGISNTAIKEQSQAVSAYFKRLLGEGASNESDTAVLMAGLYETKVGVQVTGRMTPAAVNAKWWAGLRKKIGDTKQDYLVYLPPGYNKETATRWPMILALHGKGEWGTDLNQLKESGLPARLEYKRDFPFIVIAPQMSWGETWNPWMLDVLLDEVQTKFRVDPDRVYLTGMSMGGYGAWATAIEFPERFAAVAPICGGADPADAERIKDLPIWAFHGMKDGVVPFRESERMVDTLRVLGADIRFTPLPDAGHDAWTAAYATDELYSWFLEHKRPHPQQVTAQTGGAVTPKVPRRDVCRLCSCPLFRYSGRGLGSGFGAGRKALYYQRRLRRTLTPALSRSTGRGGQKPTPLASKLILVRTISWFIAASASSHFSSSPAALRPDRNPWQLPRLILPSTPAASKPLTIWKSSPPPASSRAKPCRFPSSPSRPISQKCSAATRSEPPITTPPTTPSLPPTNRADMVRS